MLFTCQLSLLFIFLMSSSSLSNDLSGASTNSPLALSSVFVLVLILRAIDKLSLIKFALILYLSFSIFLSFRSLNLLKGFCLLNFAQKGSGSVIFKDAG